MLTPAFGSNIAGVDIKAVVDETYIAQLEATLDKNLKAAADYFGGVLQPQLPELSGHLRATTTTKKNPKTKKNPQGGYRVSTELYLFFFEYGTETKDGKVRQPAKPITNTLLAQHEAKIVDIITEGM